MYKVTFMIYEIHYEVKFIFNTHSMAAYVADTISLSVVDKWTRHRATPKLIISGNNYHNLFNEGSIVISPAR